MVTTTTRVLVAEDHPDQREMMHAWLSSSYQVDTAADGGEAIEMLKTRCYDLIITDLAMPVTGYRVIVEARRGLAPETPIIVCSGEAKLEDQAAAMNVAGYVAKPCDKATLITSVERVLRAKKAAIEDDFERARRAVYAACDEINRVRSSRGMSPLSPAIANEMALALSKTEPGSPVIDQIKVLTDLLLSRA